MSDQGRYAIQAQGLTKRFGELVAVNQLNLSIPKSRIYGFLGPNGSGKTTAIRMLCGLLTPTQGSANVLGLNIPEQADRLKPHIGYMTQKFSLYGELTVLENLNFIADVYAYDRKTKRARIAELIERYNLQAQRRQLAGTMSGGQKQRLALACAVLNKPQLLLLDEPTSAVDPKSRRDFWAQLFALADNGTTILVSTHYMDEAERCHHLAILDSGVKVADGTPAQLRSQTGMSVVEVQTEDTQQAQALLSEIPEVASITQLGLRLRAMLPDKISAPINLVRDVLARGGIEAQSEMVPASLEDVFVAVTLPDTNVDTAA